MPLYHLAPTVNNISSRFCAFSNHHAPSKHSRPLNYSTISVCDSTFRDHQFQYNCFDVSLAGQSLSTTLLLLRRPPSAQSLSLCLFHLARFINFVLHPSTIQSVLSASNKKFYLIRPNCLACYSLDGHIIFPLLTFHTLLESIRCFTLQPVHFRSITVYQQYRCCAALEGFWSNAAVGM